MATISHITCQDFMGLETWDISLPDKGLVLVTGPNGAGKSAGTLVATGWGLFGKAARWPQPSQLVREGAKKASVEVKVGVGSSIAAVRRERALNRSATLTTSGIAQGDTTPKTQQAVTQAIGMGFQTWLSTHTVSAATVAEFATSTDAGRKEYIERAAGLSTFSAAHLAATEARRQRERELVGIQHSRQLAMQRIEAAERRLETLLLSAPQPPQGETQAAAQARISGIVNQMGEITRKRSNQTVVVTLAERDAERLSGGVCGLCKQPIPRDHAHGAAKEAHLRALAELNAYIQETEPLLAELAKQEAEARAALSAAVARAAQQAAWERAKTERDRAETEILEESMRLADLDEAITAAERALRIAEHVERTLSPKGFRSHAMAQALQAVNALANAYLGWLNPKLSVKLSPVSSKKNGDVTDEISLEITGEGGGGYGGRSDGQRRRIDLAMVLAMGALSSSRGTLFMDECLDHLDDDGISAVMKLVEHLASERCVVLITHNHKLMEMVPKATVIQL